MKARIALCLAAVGSLAGKASAVPSNQQLTIAITQEFETLNPLILSMVASQYLSLFVDRQVVLVDHDWNYVCILCDKMPTIENGLAKVIEDKGKKKVRAEWRLKQGLTWGDGKPVTAKDFQLAWEIGKSPNVAVPSKDVFDRIEAVDLDPADPLKFVTIFNEPRYDFYQIIINPIPSHIEGPIWAKTKDKPGAYEKQTAYTTDALNPGLYNGPYVISEIKLGSHVVMKKNPHFAGKVPQIEKIVVKLIPNTQTLEAALLSGEIDMVGELGMQFDQAVEFDKRLARDAVNKERYKVLYRDGLTFEHIDLNLRNPILTEKNVRKALMYALDRNKISQALFAGKQLPATTCFHKLDYYYTDDVIKYDFDLKKAGDLLDSAGWKLGADGLRYKNGQKLELNLMTTAGNKTRELVEQFIQAEYKKAGIALTIKNEPGRVFFGETLNHGAFPGLAMYAWMSSPDNPPRSTLYSKEIPTKENGWNGQNYGGFSNKRADELLEEVYREFDLNKRKALMVELMKIYTDEVPVLPLYMRAEIAVVPTKLNNFKITGHQYLSSLAAEDWSVGPQAH